MVKNTKKTISEESWSKEFDKKFLPFLVSLLPDIPNRNIPYEIKSFIHSLLSQERQKVLGEEVEKYKDALIWCSGSKDFQEGGVARKGWLKICKPLLQTLKEEK